MLLDESGVAAFRQAIFETVNEGDIVIDLGSGPGVLALKLWVKPFYVRNLYQSFFSSR
jgi:predicted RNA methylase